uniref:Immunoglobulin V-set domain-containing protein n=1 Tax=Oreochromis aureus TaxID=47969 RepID=A0AAZ1XFA6_OREAU
MARLFYNSSLTLCLFPLAGQTKFTMSAEQEVYQAEENSNITMTWLLHFDTNRPPDFLQINLINVKKKTRVFFYNSETGTEVYPDENYRGRVQCDSQLARKGRLECVLTDLRLNDTGTYHCIVVHNEEVSSKTCDLNVQTLSRTETIGDYCTSQAAAGSTFTALRSVSICIYGGKRSHSQVHKHFRLSL